MPQHRAKTAKCAGIAVVAAASVLAAGCVTGTDPCIEFEYGDCTYSSQVVVLRVSGFPPALVDSAGQGHLRIGDTLTLRAYNVAPGQGVPIAVGTWGYSTPTLVFQLLPPASDALRLVAVGPGELTRVQVDGRSAPISACDGDACVDLVGVIVDAK